MRKDYRVIWVTCCAPSFGNPSLAGDAVQLNDISQKLTFWKIKYKQYDRGDLS
jgi:hypothetical protein